MCYYEIIDPRNPPNNDFRPLIRILSEKQIFDWYYQSWRLDAQAKGYLADFEECLYNFVVVHWANYIGDF